jgi:glycosyltransferase involved in cell wall biosynthesis
MLSKPRLHNFNNMLRCLHKPKNRHNICSRRIALLATRNSGGGLQKVMLNIGKGLLEHGYNIDFVFISRKEQSNTHKWPPEVRMIAINKTLPKFNLLKSIISLLKTNPIAAFSIFCSILIDRKIPGPTKALSSMVHYLETSRPAVILSGMPRCNLLACLASQLTSVQTKIVVSEHNLLSNNIASNTEKGQCPRFWRSLPKIINNVYNHADGIIAVSNGVGDDLAQTVNIKRDRIQTIYNPIVDSELLSLANAPPPHPWLTPDNPPVILGAGRLSLQKDFTTLLKAFALLRDQLKARLIILGEGEEREHLERCAVELSIHNEVTMPGWVANPFAYMAHAAAFALSSRYEGFGNVIVEALACGCPVVSTDCPSGPAEILEWGKYGHMVPMGNPEAMSTALATVLDTPPNRPILKERAMKFSVDRAVDQYIAYFRQIGIP